MITITRRLAATLRSVFRRALAVTPRGPSPPVVLETSCRGLAIRCWSHDAAIEYVMNGALEPETLVVPLELLLACEGRREEPVTIETDGCGNVLARWQEGAVPRVERFPTPPLPKPAFPPLPAKLEPNPPTLLDALHEAMETTDRQAVRYALNAIQLQGGKGVVGATDGRALLLQAGFRFGWDGDAFVARNPIFGSKELPRDQPVLIGKSDEWLTVQIQPWTIHLRLIKEARFPKLEDHTQSPRTARAMVNFSDLDAEFLVHTLSRLPGHSDSDSPVTVELNGSVVVRAKGESDSVPTEVVLSRSTWTGTPLHFSTNRSYLERALRLGLRELYVFDKDNPVQCRDQRRRYVWAVLAPDAIIKPTPEVIRIDSVQAGATAKPPHSRPPTPAATEQILPSNERSKTAMSNKSPPSNGHVARTAAEAEGVTVEALIDQAEALRESLRQSLLATGNLVAGLKQHRKRNRLVSTTLATLRQLQSIGG